METAWRLAIISREHMLSVKREGRRGKPILVFPPEELEEFLGSYRNERTTARRKKRKEKKRKEKLRDTVDKDAFLLGILNLGI
jgi:hypothetical protein